MPMLEVAPTQWADLKELEDVEPINDNDVECLAEIREVLKKHGKRERFGVALLHKHFEMEDGEVLVENTNKATRELTLKPAKKETAGDSVPTIWMLMDSSPQATVLCKQCYEEANGLQAMVLCKQCYEEANGLQAMVLCKQCYEAP